MALVQGRTELATASVAATLGLVASRALSAADGALILPPPPDFHARVAPIARHAR